jgi:gliding motility-associated-like protein
MNMNTLIRIITVGALLVTIASESKAQNVLDNKIYRVTGYKKGDNTISSMSNYAEVIPPLSIYIPSAFTPNGDGLNDMFGVKGEGIQDYRLLIYNRWGVVIFESTNAKNQWDGKYEGQPVETGTYVVQVFAKGLESKGKVGAVTVVY